MHVISAQILEQWDTLTDEQVVGHILTGQTALFEILMRRYNERLYRVARSIARDDGEAEDVMQQAYVNAYANLRQFAGKARFSTWLTRIAINDGTGASDETREVRTPGRRFFERGALHGGTPISRS